MKYLCLFYKVEMVLQKVSSCNECNLSQPQSFSTSKKNQKSASICVIGLSGVSTIAFICCFITPWAFAGKQDRLWIWKAAGLNRGFPHGASGKEPSCISRRCNEMQVWSLGWEEGMATHFSVFVWRIPWTKKPDRLQSIGSQRVGHKLKQLSMHTGLNSLQGQVPMV